MTRAEFERADEIIEEVNRLSDLVEAFLNNDNWPDVEIRVSNNKAYYFNNNTPLGKSIIKSIEETVTNYINNLKNEFEKL